MLVGAALVVPLLDCYGGVLDEVAEGLGLVGVRDGPPECGDAGVDVVEMNLIYDVISE